MSLFWLFPVVWKLLVWKVTRLLLSLGIRKIVGFINELSSKL